MKLCAHSSSLSTLTIWGFQNIIIGTAQMGGDVSLCTE